MALTNARGESSRTLPGPRAPLGGCTHLYRGLHGPAGPQEAEEGALLAFLGDRASVLRADGHQNEVRPASHLSLERPQDLRSRGSTRLFTENRSTGFPQTAALVAPGLVASLRMTFHFPLFLFVGNIPEILSYLGHCFWYCGHDAMGRCSEPPPTAPRATGWCWRWSV